MQPDSRGGGIGTRNSLLMRPDAKDSDPTVASSRHDTAASAGKGESGPRSCGTGRKDGRSTLDTRCREAERLPDGLPQPK